MKNQASVPARKDIPREAMWHLEDIFADEKEWQETYQSISEDLPRLEGFCGKLGESAKTLCQGLDLYYSVMLRSERLYVYAHMRRDEDNALACYQEMTDKAWALCVRAETAMAGRTTEILAIPPERLKAWCESEPRLGAYAQFFREVEHQRAHTLDETGERILAMAGDMASGPDAVFTMLSESDMHFPKIAGPEGKRVEVSQGRYHSFMESSCREVRRAAQDGLHKAYGKFGNTIAAAYAASVKTDVFFAKARKYGSALDAALHPDGLAPQQYDGLIDAAREALPLLHRYFAVKKKALGLDELHQYDLYVPLGVPAQEAYTYQEGCALVEEGLAALGEDYLRVLREGFAGGWVDVFENRGKTSGAYSWGVWDAHPYVLMNWQGTTGDVLTLAHEMGHALHSWYSNRAQAYHNSGYKLILAEVASTCNEALLMRHLAVKAKDRDEKIFLLARFLEEFRGTVFRQMMFAEFERDVHRLVEQGGALSKESLSAIYTKIIAGYHGEGVVLDPCMSMEWARIPHFYNAFYVYKYATGFSAALALSDQLLQGEEGARERYIGFLSGGGSRFPLELLRDAGVDLSTPMPLRLAMNRFEEALTELENLI